MYCAVYCAWCSVRDMETTATQSTYVTTASLVEGDVVLLPSVNASGSDASGGACITIARAAEQINGLYRVYGRQTRAGRVYQSLDIYKARQKFYLVARVSVDA